MVADQVPTSRRALLAVFVLLNGEVTPLLTVEILTGQSMETFGELTVRTLTGPSLATLGDPGVTLFGSDG
jgi:hypothetical protein